METRIILFYKTCVKYPEEIFKNVNLYCISSNLTFLLTLGRYLFLNAIANQLRYPNSHTHYFSCTLLYLFAEANTEAIQEQITRFAIFFIF